MPTRNGEWMTNPRDMEEWGEVIGRSNASSLLANGREDALQHFRELTKAIGMIFFGVQVPDEALAAFEQGFSRGWEAASAQRR